MSFYSNSNGKGGPQAEGWEHQGPVLAGMGSLPPAAGLAGPRAPVSLLFRAQRSPDCWPLSVWQWKGEAEKPSGQSHLCTSPTHPRPPQVSKRCSRDSGASGATDTGNA